MRHDLAPALLGLSALALLACTPAPTVPTAGTTVNAQFWKDYQPVLKPGMKWTYAETLLNGGTKTTGETTQEVTEVQGGTATLKTTGKSAMTGGEVNVTATASVQTLGILDGLPATYKSEGAVDVAVPFKSFQGAAKISVVSSSQEGTMVFYLYPGVGLIKSILTNASGGMTTTSFTRELKSFVAP